MRVNLPGFCEGRTCFGVFGGTGQLLGDRAEMHFRYLRRRRKGPIKKKPKPQTLNEPRDPPRKLELRAHQCSPNSKLWHGGFLELGYIAQRVH